MQADVRIWEMVREVELELALQRQRRLAPLGPFPAAPPGVLARSIRMVRAAAERCYDRLGRTIQGRRRPTASPAISETGRVPRAGGWTGVMTMKWVTRERPGVDRIACPWLIKRFVDPVAEFLYVPPGEVAAVAEREGAIPYDAPGVELGHRGAECSFDAIVKKYHLTDPALDALALIVRGADTGARDLTPESLGLMAIAEGFRLVYEDDHEQLERELPVYDALYAYCRRRLEQT